MTNESPVAAEHAFQLPDWLAYSVALATTVGVLVALFVAFWNVSRNRREREELRAAQARKVVPAATHSEILGARMWVLAVLNRSEAMVRHLSVEVVGYDAEGQIVENATELADDKVDLSQAFSKAMPPGFAKLMDMVLNPMPAMDPSRVLSSEQLAAMQRRGPFPAHMLAAQQQPNPKAELQQAIGAIFTSEWPTTLTPTREVSMAVQAVEAVRTLTVTISFEDEAGFQWRRTDDGMPELISSGAKWLRWPWSR
ncbi:hypothetical protein [Gordonia jacobaea]|uniref:hypothetical protein n=1 Tax=Gordonia jacobaea TaxID=122202 RepID=UPI003D73562D